MLVDKVSEILHNSFAGEGSQGDEFQTIDDEERLEDVDESGDDCPDDLMTFSYFQDGTRREALIQKGVHDVTTSHKRVELKMGKGVYEFSDFSSYFIGFLIFSEPFPFCFTFFPIHLFPREYG